MWEHWRSFVRPSSAGKETSEAGSSEQPRVSRTAPNTAPCSPSVSCGGGLALSAGRPAQATGSPDKTPPLSPTRPSNSSKLQAEKLAKLLTTSINFRDVNITQHPSGPLEDTEEDSPQAGQGVFDLSRLHTGVQKNKLIIIMVGLPGRGKTFLCNKILRYLSWLGHPVRHFNVGQYRRRQKAAEEFQDANFFDHNNQAAREQRERAMQAALQDMLQYLDSDASQVAIFDATNSTKERRDLLRSHFHGKWQYLFIETICNDSSVLEQNYRNKLRYSPDYTGQNTDPQQAMDDFKARIGKYEAVYESIDDRNLHYIKLINMVTGRGYMDINRISGYLPGKLVFFLMQVCKAGLNNPRKIWLTRHGESEYNQQELIGGDSNLSERGEKYASALPDVLLSRLPQGDSVSVSVWTSTLKRTNQTARYIPFPKLRWKALDEINAGICDGMTYKQIEERYPQEFEARKLDKLKYRYPSGESYLDVIQRVEPVIIEAERERESVVIISHQAVLRAIYAYFMAQPLEQVPRLEVPLHSLIELTPMPDGTMTEVVIPLDIPAAASSSSH